MCICMALTLKGDVLVGNVCFGLSIVTLTTSTSCTVSY